MPHPAVYIVTGLVIAAAAVIAVMTTNRPQATGYGRSGRSNGSRYTPPSPPPSPPRRRERRRRSPERRTNSTVHVTCRNCGKSPYITVYPCNHESLCRGCFTTYLETNDTCPDCRGRIDSCMPPISPYGKCEKCRRFTKLFKFLDCNHSPSLCIRCFEERDESYKVCPTCNRQIRGSDPSYRTSGTCEVCGEFTRFASFQPCGHRGKFCRRHALQFLDNSNQECSECADRVERVV